MRWAKRSMRFSRHELRCPKGGREDSGAGLPPPSPEEPFGPPSAGLSLGGLLASRARLRFTRRHDDKAKGRWGARPTGKGREGSWGFLIVVRAPGRGDF